MEIHSSITSSEELMHYGRKGMKWYQNIFTKDKGGSGKKGKSDNDDDDGSKSKQSTSSKTSSNSDQGQPKPKSVKEMSDAELKAKIDRMDLENRYKESFAKLNPDKTKRGKDFVMRVLEGSAENIAKQFATYAMGTAVNKAFAEVYKDPAIVNPKKGQKDK